MNARDIVDGTALMHAAEYNQNPEVITILLKAGAGGKAGDSARKTAFDYAQENEKLKGTDAYWKLNEAISPLPLFQSRRFPSHAFAPLGTPLLHHLHSCYSSRVLKNSVFH